MPRQSGWCIAWPARWMVGGVAVLSLVAACTLGSAGNTSRDGMPTLAPMLERVLPGVVSIAASGPLSAEEMALVRDPEFRRMFGLPKRVRPEERNFLNQGSGIVIDASGGVILTTHHLVDGADVIKVQLADTRRLAALLVGADAASDIAVIRVEASDLVAVPLGNSDELRVGDYVVAIGNPFGLAQTATLGIVSGLGVRVPGEPDTALIQTDASINPGNSGGALVNLKGELVGINDSVIGSVISNSGIGFAIPITPATRVIDGFLRHDAAQSHEDSR
ncbi:trypsin-like serine protease [Azospirillum sp. RWY-5-1]|uniref:Trypsin-like serine protease n=1 Tax=Azospirillum oleiclasticum TaxID=2735135 RepID=A0ABX2TCT8_9PROT|nr:trypsin-like peptidase domain-containing protein [Azospirillum oleiclasticum]NYZ14857.1 trypsin-like serine protease [Azospirillum oleiclasticum]NYZ22157.1 trypsin-like serine protease [Azospirillum oleiclasticum]